MGESVTEATVATWFKKPGDTVAVDEMLCELETDKVTVEVPSPVAGTLSDIVAAEGETVGVDALLATIAEGAAGAKSAPAKTAEKAPDPIEAERAESAAVAVARAKAAKARHTGSVAVMVPTLGESVTEATVSTWFKKVGDSVSQDEMLCELETDKVSVEVPAPAAGVLTAILAAEGATVAAGGKLAEMSGSADGTIEPGLRPAETAAPAPVPWVVRPPCHGSPRSAPAHRTAVLKVLPRPVMDGNFLAPPSRTALPNYRWWTLQTRVTRCASRDHSIRVVLPARLCCASAAYTRGWPRAWLFGWPAVQA